MNGNVCNINKRNRAESSTFNIATVLDLIYISLQMGCAWDAHRVCFEPSREYSMLVIMLW